MSSGGGGPTEPYPPPDSGVDCADLKFRTQVSSPVAAVVSQLAVGDVLEIELSDTDPPTIDAIYSGQRAGSITDRVAALLRCLRDGHDYEAEVTAIDGGAISLDVRHA